MRAAAYADDIRSVTNTLTALEAQCETVSLYTDQNCLKINVAKCELLTTDRAMDETVCTRPDCSPFRSMQMLRDMARQQTHREESNRKECENARKAFFSFGSVGAFHGQLKHFQGD